MSNLGQSSGNFTVGFNKTKVQQLLSEYKTRATAVRAYSDINGTNFTNLVSSIRKYWTGPDADAFISKLQGQVGALDSQIVKAPTVAETIANEYVNSIDELSKKSAEI